MSLFTLSSSSSLASIRACTVCCWDSTCAFNSSSSVYSCSNCSSASATVCTLSLYCCSISLSYSEICRIYSAWFKNSAILPDWKNASRYDIFPLFSYMNWILLLIASAWLATSAWASSNSLWVSVISALFSSNCACVLVISREMLVSCWSNSFTFVWISALESFSPSMTLWASSNCFSKFSFSFCASDRLLADISITGESNITAVSIAVVTFLRIFILFSSPFIYSKQGIPVTAPVHRRYPLSLYFQMLLNSQPAANKSNSHSQQQWNWNQTVKQFCNRNKIHNII